MQRTRRRRDCRKASPIAYSRRPPAVHHHDRPLGQAAIAPFPGQQIVRQSPAHSRVACRHARTYRLLASGPTSCSRRQPIDAHALRIEMRRSIHMRAAMLGQIEPVGIVAIAWQRCGTRAALTGSLPGNSGISTPSTCVRSTTRRIAAATFCRELALLGRRARTAPAASAAAALSMLRRPSGE